MYFIYNDIIHIFFISQYGHHIIKINHSGFVESECDKTNMIYFMNLLVD
jgi:hypothetical protein